MRTIVNAKRPTGFTLIELSIVILIIGILLSFVLMASSAGLESARVRATQALIAKLNAGLEERLEAILASQVAPNGAHQFIASINPPGVAIGASPMPWGISGADQRAAVLARMDQIRAEFPDVFFIRPSLTNGGGNFGLYPIQFAGVPYPNPADTTDPEQNTSQYTAYVLPLGNSVSPDYHPDPTYVPGGPISRTGPGALPLGAIPNAGTGINGASYYAAASLYKFIGYTAKGFDAIDNNGDGFVDEFLEGMSDPSNNSGGNVQAKQTFDTFVQNHRHKTARAEMLYALLVGGIGPFGNVFNAEDFRDNEVKDTDNDGVPEFVDGWGEPLQFYRAPFAYRSGLQKGDAPYNGPSEPRQTNQLDQNNQLLNIAWWSSNDPSNIGTPSVKALTIQSYFGPLADPYWVKGSFNGLTWDRSAATGRRAYMTKFLIVSGGPDREVGIPRLSDDHVRSPSVTLLSLAQAANGSVGFSGNAFTFIAGEGWASELPWGVDPVAAQANLPAWATTPYEPSLDTDYSLDDLTNQELQNQAGGFK